jgi:UDP-N-acetylglucosamine--N-acetylmuramyl-(pentapeptide) pyrophosphoryl-undecaprenol N-acetylglucosamine transferase
MRLVVTGGGTGGHVYPAIAMAGYFQKSPGNEVLFVGSATGPEGAAADDAGIEFEGLELAGLVGKSPAAALKALYLFSRAALQCRARFKRWRPDCVVGTGGYASAPACFASATAGIPLILHEMNYEPGLVTRLLSRRAGAVALAFDGTAALLKRGTRTTVTGVPVREEIEALGDREYRIKARAEGIERLGLEGRRSTLLVFGGSQGAQVLNRSLWELLPGLAGRSDLQVLHLTGRKGFEEQGRAHAQDRLSGAELLYKPVAYCEEMHLAYATADLALSRSGAGTVAELGAARLPAVLVPFPHAGGHQEMNARGLLERGAARIVMQEAQSAEKAVREAVRILDDRALLEEMQQAAGSTGPSTGTEGIAALVEELT